MDGEVLTSQQPEFNRCHSITPVKGRKLACPPACVNVNCTHSDIRQKSDVSECKCVFFLCERGIVLIEILNATAQVSEAACICVLLCVLDL